MRNPLAVALMLTALCLATPVRAQSGGTSTQITFTQQKEEEARQQLRRILAAYDLDPWIATQEVKIEAGVDPHSSPILTLNTRHLDDDKTQLSIFVHEQAHLLPEDKREAAAQDLREMYPKIPGLPTDINQVPKEQRREVRKFKQGIYNHLIVAWVELDAMTELIGEEEAREIVKKKIQMLTDEPYTTREGGFVWYNNRVLEDTREIGSIVAKHNLIITPEKGLTAVRKN